MKTELHRLVLIEGDDDEELIDWLEVPENRKRIDEGDVMGWTPLHWCCARGMVENAQILLEHGANPNAASEEGWTPAHDAARSGNLQMLQLLKKHGAKLNSATENGTTPMHYIVKFGHAKTLKWLATLDEEGKEDVDRPNNLGWTPLHFSARFGRLDAAKELIALGANVFHKDKMEKKPRQTGEEAGKQIKAGVLKLEKTKFGAEVTLNDYAQIDELIVKAEAEQARRCRELALSAMQNADLAVDANDLEDAVGHLRVAATQYRLAEMEEEAAKADAQAQKHLDAMKVTDKVG